MDFDLVRAAPPIWAARRVGRSQAPYVCGPVAVAGVLLGRQGDSMKHQEPRKQQKGADRASFR